MEDAERNKFKYNLDRKAREKNDPAYLALSNYRAELI